MEIVKATAGLDLEGQAVFMGVALVAVWYGLFKKLFR